MSRCKTAWFLWGGVTFRFNIQIHVKVQEESCYPETKPARLTNKKSL